MALEWGVPEISAPHLHPVPRALFSVKKQKILFFRWGIMGKMKRRGGVFQNKCPHILLRCPIIFTEQTLLRNMCSKIKIH